MKTTLDDFLGGKVKLYQPSLGYRAGIDPVLLAASIQAMPHQHILDVGSGVGTAAFCLAARVPQCRITGIELLAEHITLARQSLSYNHLEHRLSFIQHDITQPGFVERVDQVITNPPFFEHHKASLSAHLSKAHSHVAIDVTLEAWIGFCLKRLKPRGTITVIFPADRLHHLLRALGERVGDITVLPLFPKHHQPAKRLLIRARKGIKKGLTLLPGLVMHQEDGRYQPLIEGVLRHGEALAW